jgi:N-acetylglutamate synthase-like GNAT family acetyltransferase
MPTPNTTLLSLRDNPSLLEEAIVYFQAQWASEDSLRVYDDALRRSLEAANPLPQWYLLKSETRVIGCAGLITNDFISRGELWPWLCALYIEPDMRGQGHARSMIEHIATHTQRLGFDHLHLCTDLDGFYERFGFEYDGQGYHPWGEASRVYTRAL